MKSRKEITIILLFALLFGASIAGYKYNMSHLVLDWNMGDLGLVHMSSTRILEGDVPYDDFEYGYGPYFVYFNALLFKLFGIKMSVAKMAMTLTVIIITGATYLLGREFIPRLQAFLAALIVHVTFIPNTLVPSPGICSIAIGLITLLLICRYIRTGRKSLIFLAGLLCGVALCLQVNAGLFISAGTAMALMVADGQYLSFRNKVSGQFDIFDLRLFIVVSLIVCTIILVWDNITLKYFTLFILPVVIACAAAMKVQGRFEERIDFSERSRRRFEISLSSLIAGASAGILPGLYVYLFLADGSNFFSNLIGFAMELSGHVLLDYPEMKRTAGYLLACAAAFWLTARFANRGWLARSFWLMTLLMMAACIWLFRSYFHLTSFFSLVDLTNNIAFFLGPVVSIATGVVILLNSESKPKRCCILEDSSGIIIVLVYQVFFFLLAYPRTDLAHVSRSFPTTMILLMFLLERGRRFIVNNWPQASRNTIGKAIGSTLTLSLPVLIIVGMLFSVFRAFYLFSPDMLKWKRKQYVKLNNERADIYEYVNSAYQIEAVNRFIQANTKEGDYIFEFPTTFFYFYSQRQHPTRWLYFYPGIYSGKQDEILEDLETVKPKLAVVYDNPFCYIFNYSKIKKSYPKLVEYIERNYKTQKRVGYFVIMNRKAVL